MKKRLQSVILVLVLLLTLAPAAGAEEVPDYTWEEMPGDVAVRYTVNGTESTRVMLGDVFKVEFWINGIDPYSMLLPISWDSSVVTMYDEQTDSPTESGRKQEADVGRGFRPGASCYDSSYGSNFLPLYWNGKPVYSAAEENGDGYPYVDNDSGHCRFFYYVDAATPSAGPQMFLELTFRAVAPGDADFRFATEAEPVYDPAAPGGLTLAYTTGGVTEQALDIPNLRVIRDSSEGSIVPPRPTDPGTTTPTKPEKVLPETAMKQARHLTCWPYQSPVTAQAVVQTQDGQPAQYEDNYILPPSTLAAAINRAIDTNATAIVARMPDRLIDKENYTVRLWCSNLDDLAIRSAAQLYFETPYGYIGLDPAGLLTDVYDSSEVILSVTPRESGIRVTVQVDRVVREGFSGPVFRFILPYEAGEETPRVWSSTVFGGAYEALGKQPLPMAKYDETARAMVFVSPSAGTFSVEGETRTAFSDVPEGFWAAPAITSLTAAGIISGTEEGAFLPNDPVTRGQLAKLITCTLGTYQAPPACAFTDVGKSAWYYPYIASANAVGIVSGRSETEFAPDAPVTRQDLAVMAYQALKLVGGTQSIREAPEFTDAAAIAPYAREAVDALYRAGILGGMTETEFCPGETTTRAQAVQVLRGLLTVTENIL